MEMQTKALPTLWAAPYGGKNSPGFKKKTVPNMETGFTYSAYRKKSNEIGDNTVKKKIDKKVNYKYRPLYYSYWHTPGP